MAILFSSFFNIDLIKVQELGVFDAIIDGDNHFFINIKRLQATTVPEFKNAYSCINKYFQEIGMLLKMSNKNDKLYRQARKNFQFHEVNGINLGFAEGICGAGFGKKLQDKIIEDAYEIIKSGSEQPEIFHLVGLFEENVGPDRLSDMIACLVEKNIEAYTRRINMQLGINPENFPSYKFDDGIALNPYKKDIKLLLLPLDILHELPIAYYWDDIDRVCQENAAIRNEINLLIGERWKKMTSTMRKRSLREYIFKNPEALSRIIDNYRATNVNKVNLFHNIDYVIGFILDQLKNDLKEEQGDSFKASMLILERYKHWVEYNAGADIISQFDSKKAEKSIQKTIHAVACMFCKLNNWHTGPEEDSGRGPADFVISRGNDKTVIEVKLTSNPSCVHGLETQIEEYAKSQGTDKKIFVVLDNGIASSRVIEVQEKAMEMKNKGLSPATVIKIDAKPKASASKFKR